MKVVFEDNFDTLSVSADGKAHGTTWTNHLWYMPANDMKFYYVENSTINILANPNAGCMSAIVSVNSQGEGYAPRFGYFEARIKVPSLSTAWPSWWMINNARLTNPSIPASEFDILEGQGYEPTHYWTTLHSNSSCSCDKANSNNDVSLGIDISKDFHVFGGMWNPKDGNMHWCFDGKVVTTAPKFSTTDGWPMMLILGSQLGHWSYQCDPNTDPKSADMQVDWVRAWQ